MSWFVGAFGRGVHEFLDWARVFVLSLLFARLEGHDRYEQMTLGVMLRRRCALQGTWPLRACVEDGCCVTAI
jgi:hypothetical protein